MLSILKHQTLLYIILSSVEAEAVVVASVEEVVVQEHYEQTGIMNHRVEEHHLQLQKQLVSDLHFQSLLVLLVLVLTEKKAPMVEQLLLMI